jgi:hypothetical protein
MLDINVKTNLPTLNNILNKKNLHPLDLHLTFDEEKHKYTIGFDPDSSYVSVTTLNHGYFPKFDADEVIKNMMKGKKWNPDNKYWGMSPEDIKQMWKKNGESVSGAGTSLHYHIECFMNQDLGPNKEYTHKELLHHYHLAKQKQQKQEHGQGQVDDACEACEACEVEKSVEWKYFLNFVKATPTFKPYRTEWMIYDTELKIAGSIDMIYENDDGTLSIYDWKRVKEIVKTTNFNKYALVEEIDHLPDTNFWHYSLQLNTYKALIEKNYGKKVKELFLVKLHPENKYDNFEIIRCADLSEEMKELFNLRKKSFEVTKSEL